MEMSVVVQIVQTLGFGGVIFIIWWFDYRRFKQQDDLIKSYKSLVENYEHLAENYEKLTRSVVDYIAKNTEMLRAMKDRISNAEEVASALTLNIQTMTKLTERIKVIGRGIEELLSYKRTRRGKDGQV